MVQHIKNVPCPKCREQGNDRHGDNLATYSDGSCYCWKCGYWANDNISARKLLDRNTKQVLAKFTGLTLPSDSCLDYTNKALSWIEQYELSKQDLFNNNVIWSDSYERLIFPFWTKGELLGWQGRYFGKDPEKIKKNKWFSRGNLQSIYHIFFLGKPFIGNSKNSINSLILVEDIISAIKVSKAGFHCMPLFGVNVKSRMSQIRVLNYTEAILWLDPDQYTKMIKECNRERLNGFKMHPVLSDKDPKCYSIEEIQKFLGK